MYYNITKLFNLLSCLPDAASVLWISKRAIKSGPFEGFSNWSNINELVINNTSDFYSTMARSNCLDTHSSKFKY